MGGTDTTIPWLGESVDKKPPEPDRDADNTLFEMHDVWKE
jgi:hypothetical protein